MGCQVIDLRYASYFMMVTPHHCFFGLCPGNCEHVNLAGSSGFKCFSNGICGCTSSKYIIHYYH